MPAVATATAGSSLGENERIFTNGQPEQVNEPNVQDDDQMKFSGDGLNTGVRVLSTQSPIRCNTKG